LVFVLTGWVLVLLALAILAFAALVPIPEIETGTFSLEPEDGFVTVQAEREGIIEEILVQEGEHVEVNEVIAVFRSPNLLELSARRDQQSARKAYVEKMARQQIAAIDEELNQAQTEKEYSIAVVARRKLYVERQAEVLEIFESAKMNQLSSIIEMNDYEVIAAEAEADLLEAEANLARLNREITDLKAQREQIEMEMTQAVEQLEVTIASLNRDLVDVSDNGQEVRSITGGTVTQVFYRQPGTVIQRGERLFAIAPEGKPLLARVRLPETALPRVEIGQGVRLSLAAFPYQRFGMADGEVSWLSPQRQQIEGAAEQQFIALVAVYQDQRFQTASLLAGMEGEARIVVGKRTLLEYAFEPIRALREQMRTRSGK
jgi:multidrug efflux pump subunit AcrA (membrane-fusion protein)